MSNYGKITKHELDKSLIDFIEGYYNIDNIDDDKLSFYYNIIILDKKTNILNIPIQSFNQQTDILLLFENGTYVEQHTDYQISKDNKFITGIKGDWDIGTVFHVDIFKNAKKQNTINKTSYLLTSESNLVPINIESFDQTIDEIMIMENGIYIEKNIDYTISEDNKFIITKNGLKWNSKTQFNFIILKNGIIKKEIFKSNVKIDNENNIINIGLINYNKHSDSIFVFENGIHIDNTLDFEISKDSKTITNKKGKWNKDTIFEFIIIKDILLNSNKIFETSITLQKEDNKVNINIPKYGQKEDGILVFQNSVYIEKDIHYIISDDNKNIKSIDDVNWRAGTKFNIIVLNDFYTDCTLFKSHTSIISESLLAPIQIDNFDKISDTLFVFKNGTFIDSSDYLISDDSKNIIKINQNIKWKNSNFYFIVIKNSLKSEIVNTNCVILDSDKDTIDIPLQNYNCENDKLMIYINSVFVDTNIYSIINNGKTIKNNINTWKKGSKINFISIRNTIEHLKKLKRQFSDITRANLSYELNIELNKMIECIKKNEQELIKFKLEMANTIDKLTKQIEVLEKK